MSSISSKIFIDGGLSTETMMANETFLAKTGRPLDGQTTNPTLIAKNLKARMEKEPGMRLTDEVAVAEYRKIASEISRIIPNGSVSVQVFSTLTSRSDELVAQARERSKWIPNVSIKLPCIKEGLKTASEVCKEFPVNITLVFSQEQAAAVYEATRGAKYPVFISPFVGRLDDIGENGMQVVENILRLYKGGDGHVEVLTASVRNLDHLKYALKLGSNIITLPYKVFTLWETKGFEKPADNYVYPSEKFRPISYRSEVVLGQNWESYDIHHTLTDKGVEMFTNDWNGLFG